MPDRSNGTAATNLGPVEMDAILPVESLTTGSSDLNFNYRSKRRLVDGSLWLHIRSTAEEEAKEAALLRKATNEETV